MKIKVRFFDNEIIKAIGNGIYKISVQRKDNKSKLLYVGESYSMIVRCAEHLYQLNKNPNYFGFTDKTIEQDDIVLIIEVHKEETSRSLRKKEEKKYIKENNPISQSGRSDRMKPIKEKIIALNNFLNEEKRE